MFLGKKQKKNLWAKSSIKSHGVDRGMLTITFKDHLSWDLKFLMSGQWAEFNCQKEHIRNSSFVIIDSILTLF